MKYKDPKADLRYWLPVVNRKATIITLLFLMLIFLAFPRFRAKPLKKVEYQVAIQVENVPITKQEIKKKQQPKAKLAEVIEAEKEETPDTVELAETAIDTKAPPPPPPTTEEVFDFFAVEEKPRVLKKALPKYPELAKKSGLEGVVVVEFVVDTDGSVVPNSAKVIQARPEGIFEEEALKAIYKWKFSPAMQRDRKVRVRWQQPIIFKLK